jgi:hypothetical protein
MPQTSAPQLSVLPRELIDAILAELISLCDDDPAYQWACLRNITRYYRPQIEQHFLSFWVPKLTLTLTDVLPGMHFAHLKEDRKSTESQDGARNGEDHTARFAALYTKKPYAWLVGTKMEHVPDDFEHRLCLTSGQASADLSDWFEKDMGLQEQSDEFERRTCPARQDDPELKSAFVTLGEGFLDRGYTKGGIMNHFDSIPGLSIGSATKGLCLDWKAVFTQLFGEEMLMRRFRDALMKPFLPTLEARMSEEERHGATHTFLRGYYQIQRGELLASYRTHVAHNLRRPFDMTPFLSLPKTVKKDHTVLNTIFLREESMVFQVPGWQAFDIREVARLRISEEMMTEDMTHGIEWGYSGSQYLEDMTEREAEMSGEKKVGEECLEEWLKGDALDPQRFGIRKEDGLETF